MKSDEIDVAGRQFLIQLFEQTKGDSSVQVSMYDIGDQLGWSGMMPPQWPRNSSAPC